MGISRKTRAQRIALGASLACGPLLVAALALAGPAAATGPAAAQSLHSEIPASIQATCTLQSDPSQEAEAEYRCDTSHQGHGAVELDYYLYASTTLMYATYDMAWVQEAARTTQMSDCTNAGFGIGECLYSIGKNASGRDVRYFVDASPMMVWTVDSLDIITVAQGARGSDGSTLDQYWDSGDPFPTKPPPPPPNYSQQLLKAVHPGYASFCKSVPPPTPDLAEVECNLANDHVAATFVDYYLFTSTSSMNSIYAKDWVSDYAHTTEGSSCAGNKFVVGECTYNLNGAPLGRFVRFLYDKDPVIVWTNTKLNIITVAGGLNGDALMKYWASTDANPV